MNMNEPQQFQLINGVFTAEDASRILGAMVKGKIDYHTLERHSHSERDKAQQTRSEERLDELRDLNARLKELLETAVTEKQSLRISGVIEISPAD
jgi:cell shape-determining protein MreC